MRVTQNTNYETVRESIRKSRERMENLQKQTATLKKLNTPSDDPIGTSKVLELRTDKVNNSQFLTNAKLAETFLVNTDHALGELADLTARAKEIALSQSSGASSNDQTRLGVAEEVTQLYNQAVATANRRVGERYLFGGYKTNRPPVDAEGRYLGDDGQMMVEIAKDVFISVNVPGLEAFNTHPRSSYDWKHRTGSPELTAGENRESAQTTADGASGQEIESQSLQNTNVFDELQNLRIGLLTGDLDGIRDTLERFDDIHGRLVAMRARIGSRVQGLQTSSQALERHDITNAQLSSTIEDADMAQVVSDLAKEETVFRSALASSQKLVQPTLLDFLK